MEMILTFVPEDQVISAGLQVYKPTDYGGPQDVQKLGTIVLCYIPSGSVPTLAAEISAKNSALYQGLPKEYADLASHFVASFDVTSITVGGSSAAVGGNNGSNPASGSSHSRQDAIIGVVTALGGVTLIVLVLLIFRALKRRQELAHRRMSDPPAEGFAGYRPPNQEFDRDSVGGQRRRSFYFAADSLASAEGERGAVANDNPFSDQTRPAMRQRAVGAGAQPISTPVLRDNTMNW
jgi:hypothetical protein